MPDDPVQGARVSDLNDDPHLLITVFDAPAALRASVAANIAEEELDTRAALLTAGWATTGLTKLVGAVSPEDHAILATFFMHATVTRMA